MGDAVLDVRGLDVRYGGVRAVRDLSIAVHSGEVVGLIGPNGAGKTSAIDAITGYVPAMSGSVALAGRDITGWPVHRRARAGLVRTFQQLELFTELSVDDNLALAARATGRGDRRSVEAALAFGLGPHRDTVTSSLPQGVRRLAAIARAVAAKPDVLLLDEPAAGLDHATSNLLQERLRTLAATGIGVLLVEHDIALVMRACDRVVVIEFGASIGSGSPDEIRRDPRVIEAYLGAEVDVGTA